MTKSTRADFERNGQIGTQLYEFWGGLRGDLATRSALRRCREPEDVIGVPAYHRLCVRLRPHLGDDPQWQARLATVVGLLASVKSETGGPLISRMASLQGQRPLVSELRFRRLLKVRGDGSNATELYTALRRVLSLLNGEADPLEVASAAYFWHDTYRGGDIRREWAFTYFSALPEKRVG